MRDLLRHFKHLFCTIVYPPSGDGEQKAMYGKILDYDRHNILYLDEGGELSLLNRSHIREIMEGNQLEEIKVHFDKDNDSLVAEES